MRKIETFTEIVTTIIENDVLVGIIYDDPEKRTSVVHLCKEAASPDIAYMISGNKAQNGRSSIAKLPKQVEEISDDIKA